MELKIDETAVADAVQANEPWTTYRRADGESVFGEYAFVTGTDGLEDEDCGHVYIRETWQLVESASVWFGPPERKSCEACEGSGMSPADDTGRRECAACDGEGTVA